ncbi:MAG: Cyclic nucleotide-binding:Bacterial regulatory protein Crp [Betaproteobacteria bacterium]|jgi:CRP/FNR family cyclic AMP-dependent transcriptional regulator|nr:Cyclic nucleotide-binding:Bacterial regulatory protein Crp [Betaproteobacteria bacterium]MEA3154304.1 family transcriptional regulator, cyclic receptor protein [Betaproteobacteria bacterium]
MTNLAVNTTILKTVPLFSLFSDHELATLFPAIQHRSYPRHSFMLRAGEKTDALYIILSGKAKVVIDDGDGREVTLTTIGPSEFFGEMSLIDEKPRSASVEALEACEVLYISKPAFMACLKDNFEAAMLILRNVVARLREADRKIASLALMDVHGRVARLLMDLARDVNGIWVVDTGSEEMARMVGASREMVSRVLKEMRDGGLIRRDKRKIIVLDRASMDQRGTVR